jgi:hypothetical protein
VVGFCKHSNRSSGSVKSGEFIHQPGELLKKDSAL